MAPASGKKQPPSSGILITFEGGDGVGKTTQIKTLSATLQERGEDVVETREPGGCEAAERVRDLLVNGPVERWSAISEALLMYAARAEHLRQTIKPALARGAIVLCDRFADSTMAYQGIAGQLGPEIVMKLHEMVVGDDGPALTFILSLPSHEGIGRTKGRGSQESRFEDKGADYQHQVAAAFLEIAKANPERCRVIDAARSVDEIAVEIAEIVTARLALHRAAD